MKQREMCSSLRLHWTELCNTEGANVKVKGIRAVPKAFNFLFDQFKLM